MPRHARNVYVRRRIVAAIIALLAVGILGTGIYSAAALADPLPNPTVTKQVPLVPAGAAAAPVLPGYGSVAIGAEGWSQPLAVSGDQGPHPIASISKTITALMALDKLPLEAGESGPSRTLSAADAQLYDDAVANDESTLPTPQGSVITERQVLEAMLLYSSASHARLLATWAYGSLDAFAQAAPAWLQAHGLTGTTIVEPTGSDPRNAATPADLIKLGELVMAQPALAAIVDLPTADIPDVGQIQNSNALLGIDLVDGVKTGTTPEAGACLLFSAPMVLDGQSMRIVGVVLDGPDHPTIAGDSQKLLESVEAAFQELPVVTAGTDFGTLTTPWGSDTDIVAAQGATLPVWGAEQPTVTVSLDPVGLAPARTKVGTATYTTPEGATTTVDLVTDTAIADPGPGWRWTHPAR